MKKLLIIDGRHLLWRTFGVFPDLVVDVNNIAISIGGVYGFLTALLRIHRRYGGMVVICWEGKNNFRYKLYPKYKNKNTNINDDKALLIAEMSEQELRLKTVIRALGLTQYRAIDCEADDTMATLARNHVEAGRGLVYIYTGDSDLRQMVDDFTTVIAPGKKGCDVVYDSLVVFEKHGVEPCYIADLKALSGDSSDNIPGVRGIGPKTAVKLINVFGHVENIIANVDSADWPIADRFRLLVDDNSADIMLFKKLTELKCDVELKEIEIRRDGRKAYEYFKLYRFLSLLAPLEMRAFSEMAKND